MQPRCSFEQNQFFPPFLWSAAFALACSLALVGCQSVKVRDEPFFNSTAYAKQPPVTIAIAPLKNATSYEEAHMMMRRALYGSLSPLGYRDVELGEVDRFVAKQAMEHNRAPEELDRWYIAQPELADAVVFGEVKDISRLFLLFYSSIRVDVQLEMVDSRTKAVTYSNDFRVVNRQFNLPSSWFGIGSSLFTSLWHMRGDQVGTSVKEAADIVSERIDQTIGSAVAQMASVAKVNVRIPQKHLKAGEQICVEVEAPEGKRLEFSIGELARGLRMEEVRPGIYEGKYSVRPGDNVKFAYASVTLFDAADPEGSFIFAADEQPFELDTQPPGPYFVDKWGTYPNRRGLALHIAPGSPDTEAAAKLHVYRRPARSREKPQWLGVAEENEFRDSSALAGSQYEYIIVAEDAAGNPSAPEARLVRVPGEVAQSSFAP